MIQELEANRIIINKDSLPTVLKNPNKIYN